MAKRGPLSVRECNDKISDLRQKLAQAEEEKRQALHRECGIVGEIAVSILDVSTDKKECKNYFVAVKTLISKYSDEFTKLLSDAPKSDEGSDESIVTKDSVEAEPVEQQDSVVNQGKGSSSHRLPNNASDIAAQPSSVEAGE